MEWLCLHLLFCLGCLFLFQSSSTHVLSFLRLLDICYNQEKRAAWHFPSRAVSRYLLKWPKVMTAKKRQLLLLAKLIHPLLLSRLALPMPGASNTGSSEMQRLSHVAFTYCCPSNTGVSIRKIRDTCAHACFHICVRVTTYMCINALTHLQMKGNQQCHDVMGACNCTSIWTLRLDLQAHITGNNISGVIMHILRIPLARMKL